MDTPRRLVVVVSHTHWDREWYWPFERLRLRLCDLIGELLDLLDAGPAFRHFLLDGQTVVLEDLLALRPEWEDRIRGHVAAGRLSIGPWYVLQDEFLVGGESLVRNLQEGLRTARRFGRAQAVGYLPDAFGHVAQLPRVLRGFGLETAVLWRGVADLAPGVEWRWRAPAGAEVLCLWLPEGYGQAANLPADAEAGRVRLHGDLDASWERSRARVLPWMNGSDHLPAQAHLPGLLAALREAEPDLDLLHGSLEEVAAAVRERVDVAALPAVEGELRRPGAAPVLPGVLSARSWQKRHHDRAEALLVRLAEPFSALAGRDRRAEVRHAWRILLRCQPHDSVCGCSVDAVHDELDVRLGRVVQVAKALRNEAVRALAGSGARRDGVHGGLALASPHPWSASALPEVRLELPDDGRPFRLVGPGGEVPYDLLGSVRMEPEVSTPPEPSRTRATREHRLRLLAEDLPPHGLRLLRVERGESGARAAGLSPHGRGIGNGTVTVVPAPGGLEVLDRASGALVRLRFTDEADRGDEYNHDPVAGDRPQRSQAATWTSAVSIGRAAATLTLDAAWPVPARLSEARDRRSGEALLGLHLAARLIPGVRRVELDLIVDNPCRDHRLRARLDLPGAPETLLTDSPLGWIRRPAGLPPPATGREDPVATHPMSSVAAVDLEGARLGLGTVGLREVELTPDGTLLLTVLRCVGWLSRGDLATRRGHAGPALRTPGAQGIGRHVFRAVLAFDDLDTPATAVARAVEPGLWAPAAVPLAEAEPGDLPLLTLEPASVRLSAVKRAEADDRLIVRLLGPETGTAAVRLRLEQRIRRAWLSDLDEREGSLLPLPDEHTVGLDLAAGEVATVALEPEA